MYRHCFLKLGLLIIISSFIACAGTSGEDGTDGTNGVDGTDGTDGVDGTDGKDGIDGDNGQACWDLDGNGMADVNTEDANGDNVVDINDCIGKDGIDGTNGSNGVDGTNGSNGVDGTNGSNGSNGTNGQACWDLDGNGVGDVNSEDVNGDNVVNVYDCAGTDGKSGSNGSNGSNGANGQACWDLNLNGVGDIASEDNNGDGFVNINDCQGDNGAPGLGYIDLEPNGMVGFVKDTANSPVVGAKVYLVPSADIPSTALALTSITVERASTVDEPLEDTITAKGTTYTQAVTDDNGVYQIATISSGSYFIVVIPQDSGHLPGGNLCRKALSHNDIIGQQIDIMVSTTPSANAEYVGPSVCMNCHGITHEKQTLHALGIRKIGSVGGFQNSSRFPDWNSPLGKFTPSGTTLYFYAYNNNSSSPDWKVSETNPNTGVSFQMRLYTLNNKYYAELTDMKGTSGAVTYEAEMSYGGGLYKQRYMTVIGTSRYVLPIQYNFEGQTDETQPYSRWVWSQYNAQNWYDESVPKLKTPPKTKSFDNNCAGCHFTGYSLTGDSTNGYKAHAVPDINGEMDFDGDGLPESLNITCETCHGPGSEHWAKAGKGKAIVSPRLLTPEREVTICAQCHTRALGVGGNATEAPMNSGGRMIIAGTSRKDFLNNYVSKLDDGLWDASKGDGLHSKKHHQQASDFLKTKKFRNSTQLLTCASCHDPHGNEGLSHQIREKLDNANVSIGEGLCASCHDSILPSASTFAARVQAHYAAKGITNISMGNISCTDCHMSKTAKSGSGRKQATLANVTYYSGDISSHLFDVPLRTSITNKASDMMPIPYTNACGTCHSSAP